jgi:fatty-acid desaturase
MIRRIAIEQVPELTKPLQKRQKSWLNILFLSLTPVIGVVGTAAHAIAFGVRWWEPALFVVLFGLVNFSVTAGYHRCFAHKAARQSSRMPDGLASEIRLSGMTSAGGGAR